MRNKKEKEKVDQPELIEEVVEQQPEENSAEEEKVLAEVPKKKTSRNSNLHEAKRAKNAEFYTRLTDIEKELRYYKKHFKGKVVFCNCNDAVHDSFLKYFSNKFNFLGLKQLICTSYGENAKAYFYNGEKDGRKVPSLDKWEVRNLSGGGDFRSDEMIDLLKNADIVCTNPPFSLFREYFAQLIQYDKKFLIVGDMNETTYKKVFPYIMENKVWLGTQFIKEFEIGANKTQKFGNKLWYTNLDHNQRHQPIDLYKNYTPEEFPKYDNYNAINVDNVINIPLDYGGVMGVPISFLDKYCPEQFKIVGIMTGAKGEPFTNGNDGRPKFYINGKGVYARILITKK